MHTVYVYVVSRCLLTSVKTAQVTVTTANQLLALYFNPRGGAAGGEAMLPSAACISSYKYYLITGLTGGARRPMIMIRTWR